MNEIVGELRRRIHGVWRRRWIVLGTAWLVMLLGSAIVTVLPDQYESSSRIYVDTESLMGPLLKGIAVQDDLTQQLSVMQNTLLSRPNLQKVIRAVDLDLDVNNEFEMDKLIERIKERTIVKVSGPKIYSVSHRDGDPKRAKDITQAFLSIFVENNLGKDRADMESAHSFIDKNIEEYKKKLQETEREMAEFRAQNSDVISPSGTSFSSRLELSRESVNESTLKLSEAKDRRDRLAAQIKKTPQFLEVTSVQVKSIDPSIARLSALKLELEKKLGKYTESHPEVVALKREFSALKARLSNSSDGKSQIPNPLYEKIQLRLLEAESAFAISKERLAAAKASYKRLQDRASAAPLLEAQMADLNRDYEILKKKYDEFRVRSESARISQDAKIDTEAIRFRIVDPPEVPTVPVGPNRLLFLVAVLFASIGGGMGIGLLLAEVDNTFATRDDLRSATGLPVLGSVCTFHTGVDNVKRFFSTLSLAVGAGAMVAYCGILAVITTDLMGPRFDLTAVRTMASGLLGIGS